MPKGGARNRSGPPPDPNSARSDRRGLTLIALPADGYDGKPPTFPLPSPTARERKVWRDAWRTPQADAWAKESWRWRTIALWVRWSVRMEESDSPASLGAVVHRLADQIGMTPAGLKENGWKIGGRSHADEYVPPPSGDDEPVAPQTPAKQRLTVVNSRVG